MDVLINGAVVDPRRVGPPTMSYGQHQRWDPADARRYTYVLTRAELRDRVGEVFERFRSETRDDEPDGDPDTFPELEQWRALGFPDLRALADEHRELLGRLLVFDEYDVSHALSGWEAQQWTRSWSVNSIDRVSVDGELVRIEGVAYELGRD